MKALIGTDTVNTVLMDMLVAYRSHGKLGNRLEAGLEMARATLQGLKDVGIDLATVTAKLESEGIDNLMNRMKS